MEPVKTTVADGSHTGDQSVRVDSDCNKTPARRGPTPLVNRRQELHATTDSLISSNICRRAIAANASRSMAANNMESIGTCEADSYPGQWRVVRSS